MGVLKIERYDLRLLYYPMRSLLYLALTANLVYRKGGFNSRPAYVGLAVLAGFSERA